LAAGLRGGQAAAVAGGQRRSRERDGRRGARAEPADRHARAQAGRRGGAMATLVEFEGASPRIAEDAFIAETAVLIGNVVIGPGASVWFGAVLRGDNSEIRVG